MGERCYQEEGNKTNELWRCVKENEVMRRMDTIYLYKIFIINILTNCIFIVILEKLLMIIKI